jgi:carbonic anhydrase/acetyltransferase-like protein (isoleucine patch superfamily)
VGDSISLYSNKEFVSLACVNTEQRLQRYCLEGSIKKDPSAFIAPNASLIGDIQLAENTSIWYNAVLRADINRIQIGSASNVQDGTVIHLSNEQGVLIGSQVTIGHLALIHACHIASNCLIGMRATIMDGASIGAYSIIGAGSLVTKNTQIPTGTLAMGSPAYVVRELRADERAEIDAMADKYTQVAKAHRLRLQNLSPKHP